MNNTVKTMRERLGWTQAELARRARLPQSNLSEIERGNRKAWPAAAKRLARALKVSVKDLFPDEAKGS